MGGYLTTLHISGEHQYPSRKPFCQTVGLFSVILMIVMTGSQRRHVVCLQPTVAFATILNGLHCS